MPKAKAIKSTPGVPCAGQDAEKAKASKTGSKFEAELEVRVRRLEAVIRGEDRLHVCTRKPDSVVEVLLSLLNKQEELRTRLQNEPLNQRRAAIMRGIHDVEAEVVRITESMVEALAE